MAPLSLAELDSVEVVAVVDNELDPISRSPNSQVQQSGDLPSIGMASAPLDPNARGGAIRELRMDEICCGAHGLSLIITGIKGDQRRTILFDTGPEEHVWERNAKRLRADIQRIEVVQLSHWHRDHSGGMLKAIKMIREAQVSHNGQVNAVHVDLHPDRPQFRGFQPPGMPPVSLEADPTFDEITEAGGTVVKSDQPHTVLDNTFLVSGEIPRVTAYEQGIKFGMRYTVSTGKWESDEAMRDERFLMCRIKGKGIVVFSGCSHAGVVNVAKHALELGGGAPLHAIMGGYHLADADLDKIKVTTADLKTLDPKILLAGHCTGWRAKFEIQSQMPGCLVPSFVGSRFVL